MTDENPYRINNRKYRWGIITPQGMRIECYRTKRDAIAALSWFQQYYPKDLKDDLRAGYP